MNGDCMNGFEISTSTPNHLSSSNNGQPAPQATSRVGAFAAFFLFAVLGRTNTNQHKQILAEAEARKAKAGLEIIKIE